MQTVLWKHGSDNLEYQANYVANSIFLYSTILEPIDFCRLWWQDSTLGSLEIVTSLTLGTVFR